MGSFATKASGVGKEVARAFDPITASCLLIAVLALAAVGDGLFWPSDGGGSLEATSVRAGTMMVDVPTQELI